MGRLIFPPSGTIYLDAQIPIYTTNKHPIYAPLLRPLWEAVKARTIEVVSSELTLMETIITPIRNNDLMAQNKREALWQQANTCLLPITEDILREAARLRATIPGLKTPDAIHAATALRYGCALFVSNDTGFRRVPNLPLTLLDDAIAAP